MSTRAKKQTASEVKVNKQLAKKVLQVVDQGLSFGLGEPIPGQMCVEAAVCYAMGRPHGDKPICVARAVRQAKITLNDMTWSNNKARAKGMRRLAIAQLGSTDIDIEAFKRALLDEMVVILLPYVIKAVKRDLKDKELITLLEELSKKKSENWKKAIGKDFLRRLEYGCVVQYSLLKLLEARNPERMIHSMGYCLEDVKIGPTMNKRLTQIADGMEAALHKCKTKVSKWVSLCDQ